MQLFFSRSRFSQAALQCYARKYDKADIPGIPTFGTYTTDNFYTPPALVDTFYHIGMISDEENLCLQFRKLLGGETEEVPEVFVKKELDNNIWKKYSARSHFAETNVHVIRGAGDAMEKPLGYGDDAKNFFRERSRGAWPKAFEDSDAESRMRRVERAYRHSCNSLKCRVEKVEKPCKKFNEDDDGCCEMEFHKDGKTLVRHMCSNCFDFLGLELPHRARCPGCPLQKMLARGEELFRIHKKGKDDGKTEGPDQENKEGSTEATAVVASKLDDVDGTATEAKLREDTKDAAAVNCQKKRKDDDGKTESPDHKNEEGSTGATAVVAAKSDVLGNTTVAKGREDTKDAAAVDSQKKGKNEKPERLAGLPSVQEKKECKDTKASAAVSAVRVSGGENIGESEENKDATDGKSEE